MEKNNKTKKEYWNYVNWATIEEELNKPDISKENINTIWGKIQEHKYDSLLDIDKNNPPDYQLPELVFNNLEKNIIEKLYPKNIFEKMVKEHRKSLLEKLLKDKKGKVDQWTEKYGEDFTKKILKYTQFDILEEKFSKDIELFYPEKLEREDADLLFFHGIEDFIKQRYLKFTWK